MQTAKVVTANMPRAESHDLSLWKKAWQILTPPQRRSAGSLFGLLVIGTFLEVLSLSMVVPALAFMAVDDPGERSPRLAVLITWLGNPSRDALVVGGVVVMLAVVVVKAAFLAFLAWRQAAFYSSIQAGLGRRLYSLYLAQPWMFHLQRNSAQLIRTTAYETGQFTAVVAALLFICTDALIMIGITALLLAVQPVGTLVAGVVLGASVMTLQRMTKPAITRWGAARQHHEVKKLQQIQEGLGGAKDVKLLGRERHFIEQYQVHNLMHALVQQRQSLIQQLPRLWYELIAVAGLCILTITMVVLGTPASRFVPTLGLFAAGAFKVLPSINRLALNTQVVWFSAAVINLLHDELRLPAATDPHAAAPALGFERGLELAHVSFRYPGASSDALHDVTLRIPRGTSVGFIGESGAGKSTIVDILLGLLEPTSGTVLVDGVAVDRNLRGWQNLIGYVPQAIYLSDDTLRRNIAFGIPEAEIDDEAVARSLRAARLDEFVAGLPEGVETSCGERGVRMSGGQRQRVGIARALYHNPSVLVLDEATSALDTDTEREVVDAVNALHGDKTLIIVAHRLSTVAHCDRVYRMHKGRVIDAGTFADVTSSAAT